MSTHDVGGLVQAAWRVIEHTEGRAIPDPARAAIGQLELMLLRVRCANLLGQLDELEQTVCSAVALQCATAGERDRAQAWAARWKRATDRQRRERNAARMVAEQGARIAAAPTQAVA